MGERELGPASVPSSAKFDDKRMELVYEVLTLASELARVPSAQDLGGWLGMLSDRAANLLVSVSELTGGRAV